MQADASMRVHMLERELARAQKDIVALRSQLRCQPGSTANPAILRTAAAVRAGIRSVMLEQALMSQLKSVCSQSHCPHYRGRHGRELVPWIPDNVICMSWPEFTRHPVCANVCKALW